jgi:hypothetical protein
MKEMVFPVFLDRIVFYMKERSVLVLLTCKKEPFFNVTNKDLVLCLLKNIPSSRTTLNLWESIDIEEIIMILISIEEKRGTGRFYKEHGLWVACCLGYVNIVRLMLQKKVYVNLDTALLKAVWNGHLDIVRELLTNGANVHASNDDALLTAARKGHLDIVVTLLSLGANVNAVNGEALLSAVHNGRFSVVLELMQRGANVHVGDDEPLILACRLGHLETVAELLKGGANVHARDDLALAWARINGDKKMINLLLLHRAKWRKRH